MNRIVYGVIAVIASFVLAESLTCNKCTVGLVGICLNPSDELCANMSSCYTGKASFPNISSFLGISSQGCLLTSSCNYTGSGSILGASYTVSNVCCDTDKCNPTTLSGAPTTRLSVGAALAAALLATIGGSLVY